MANYPASQPGSQRHTLSVLVENRPGVLARIAGLFARRAFNINSLSVSPTERPDISRVTVTADVEAVPLDVSFLFVSLSFCALFVGMKQIEK